MVQISRVLRGARILTASAILLLFVLFVGIQVRQHVLRHRVERLFSDIRDIHPHKSSWQDAQALMKRWGRAGHAETSCSSESCVYQITVGNMRGNFRLLQRLVWVRFRFLVHDNIVEQTSTQFWLEVPGDVLIFTEENFPSLDDWGLEEQLADHPFYIVTHTRIKADVQYSTDIPQNDLDKLTAFNFDCITSFRPCVEFDDVLPVAKRRQTRDQFTLMPCRIPIWALGRDARAAIIGDAVSTTETKEEEGTFENTDLRVVSSMLHSRWMPGDHLLVRAHPGEPLLAPGKRYIVLLDYDTSQALTPIKRCGVLDDTPQARQELNRGFIERNSYKGPLLGNAP